MVTLKDLFNLPLPALKDNLKEFVEISFNYWEKKLTAEPTEKPVEAVEPEKPEDTMPTDLKAVLELNRAIAEKYQATGAKSILNILAGQLATDRKCDPEDVIDEIKAALAVDDEQKEILALHPSERIAFLTTKTIEGNEMLIKKVYKKEEGATEELKQVIKSLCGDSVSSRDVTLSVQSKLVTQFNEWAAEETK